MQDLEFVFFVCLFVFNRPDGSALTLLGLLSCIPLQAWDPAFNSTLRCCLSVEKTGTLISLDLDSPPLFVQLKSFWTVINLPWPKVSKPCCCDLRLGHNPLIQDLMKIIFLNVRFS